MIEHHFYGKEYILDYDELPKNAVYMCLQHEAEVVVIDNPEDILPCSLKTDALVTNKPNVILAFGTADCAPIVLEDSENNVIGAVHAGWKSACKGIIENTVSKMQELEADPENIKAFIGPCLEQRSFETQEDMMQKFLDLDIANSAFFEQTDDTHWRFDLKGFCVMELNKAGVFDVDVSDIDTFTNDDYHSYRGFEANDPSIGYENGKYRNLTTVEIL